MKRFFVSAGLVLSAVLLFAVSTASADPPTSGPEVRQLMFKTNWGASGNDRQYQSDSIFTSGGAAGLTLRVDTTEAFVMPRFVAQGQASIKADTMWHFTVVAHETKTGTAAFPGSATKFTGATNIAYYRFQFQVSYDDGNNWYSTIADTSDMAPAELGTTDMFPRVINSSVSAGSVPALELHAFASHPGMLCRLITYTGLIGAMSVKVIGYWDF